MEKRNSIVGGIILISVGVLFLLMQLFPGFADVFDFGRYWPLLIILLGGLFLLGAFLGTPQLAIPGSIITGIGLILYYQNTTGNWASWAFVWTLIPSFVGIGLIITDWLIPGKQGMTPDGTKLIVISLAMFVVFGSFFSGFGGIGRFWPIVLIAIGAWIIWQNRLNSKSDEQLSDKDPVDENL